MSHSLGAQTLDTFALAFSSGLGACSQRFMLRSGDILGKGFGKLARRKQKRILSNLALAGSPDPAAAARRAWGQFGQGTLEMLWMMRQDPAHLLARAQVEGTEALTAPLAAGRGVLLVSAHVGNWEMVSLAAAAAGAPVAVVARALRTPRLEKRLIGFRGKGGVRTLLRGEPGTGVTAYRWLVAGKVLGCMMDRSSSGQRMSVPFLGLSTRMPLGPLRMASRSGAEVVLGSARRGEGGVHHIRFRRIATAGTLDENALGLLVGRELEADLRPRPEEWLWIYRTQRQEAQPVGAPEVQPQQLIMERR